MVELMRRGGEGTGTGRTLIHWGEFLIKSLLDMRRT